ncbi:molybdopterin converting factor subunit 1 [Peribacillus kribbensis]|uniref:molybdopterin converting factor subunit 1 n=1 Tax=Peribacillus kribbensis TaxID=356658 RepID=UPI00040E28C1|nr:molybdopterin converting factor subunit 1 [Peribacillus kribbensis]
MIKVLFFAFLKEAAGRESMEVEMSGETLADLKKKLSQEYRIENLETVMAAVNEEFAPDDTVLEEGDTVAFIPPVSGG